jgi:hypothetical protein
MSYPVDPMRLCLLVAAAVLVCGCSRSSESPERPDRMSPVDGILDLSIGEVEGDAPYIFGRVSGVTVDDRGRLIVIDSQANEARVFDAAGAHLFSFGGPGSGPGEFMYPAGLGFDAEGLLWVRDGMNSRFARYRLLDAGAEPVGVVRMEHSRPLLEAPVPFDAEGRIVDIGGRFDAATGTSVGFRLLRALDGTVLDSIAVPAVQEERFVRHILGLSGGNRGFQMFIAQPSGPRFIEAHGVTGDWALAMSDRYEVSWFAADGTLRHTIQAAVEAPLLSEAERASARERLAQSVQQANISLGDLRFGVPDRKQPLAGLFFDLDGRLWVVRSVPESADPVADVYDTQGRLVKVARWPAGISFETGVVLGDVGYGISRRPGDVDRVVRVRW